MGPGLCNSDELVRSYDLFWWWGIRLATNFRRFSYFILRVNKFLFVKSPKWSWQGNFIFWKSASIVLLFRKVVEFLPILSWVLWSNSLYGPKSWRLSWRRTKCECISCQFDISACYESGEDFSVVFLLFVMNQLFLESSFFLLPLCLLVSFCFPFTSTLYFYPISHIPRPSTLESSNPHNVFKFSSFFSKLIETTIGRNGQFGLLDYLWFIVMYTLPLNF